MKDLDTIINDLQNAEVDSPAFNQGIYQFITMLEQYEEELTDTTGYLRAKWYRTHTRRHSNVY